MPVKNIANYVLVCTSCKKRNDEKQSLNLCRYCGEALDAVFDYKKIKSRLNVYDLQNTAISTRKYLDFLPINDLQKIISLQEGGTPLYHAEKLGKKFGMKNLYVKNEGANPTGVFKDRGTLVEITKARELGVKAVIVASSGNMGASVAAYSAKAGLPCFVLMPQGTPLGKVVQVLEYGARVIKIRGEYVDCLYLTHKLAPHHGFYLAGDYVFRREGQKTAAYEICEQLEHTAPDAVIVPTGVGTNLSAIWKGFNEYFRFGLITKLPRMIAVQAQGAAVLVEAYEKHKKSYKPWKKTETICSAVAVADPIDGKLALKAVYDSDGTMIAVSDDETLKMQKKLASSEAIFCEPSSALAVAAVPHLLKKNLIGKKETVVLVATGNGLKDPMTSLGSLPTPPTLEADFKVVSRDIKAGR